ncbi:MAG: glycosyltransferase, partial [Candidatus Methanomethyliaceae archaeon]
RYICLASPDLLQMPETYLEANLITLESENLIFTVNLLGYNPTLYKHLCLGLLPGDSYLPLLRQIVRRENVQDNFVIKLSDLAPGVNVVVGRVIVHPTNHKDQALPFNNAIRGVALHLQGNEITACSPGLLIGRETPRIVHPVNTVVPVLSIPGDDRPTVFVVMPFLAVGGAERVTLDVLHQLQKDIHFVVLTTDKHEPSLGTTADAFRQITPYVYTLSDWLSPELRLSCLEYLIQRFQPVTIYIANGSRFIYDVIPSIKQRHTELRVVNQVYDHRMGWISCYKNKEIVSNISAHIGCNQKICQAYVQHGVPAERVYLIPHGVDTDLFDPENYPPERCISIKKQMGLPTEQRIITFMGRLHPQKRPMDFVEIARRFAYNTQMFFLMVGDGHLAGVIDAEVQRIGLKNLVRQPFSPAPDMLAISDVVVLPSEYEGMPLVVLEAQAMGKPVVVTDVGANREIVELTHGGVVVSKIGDIYAMMRGVEKMLQNPPDPIRVREVITSKFDVRNIAWQYKRVLLGE